MLQDDGTGLSAVPVFAVNDRFVLSKEEAAYTLSIELIVPIDYILLQCDVPIDLLDVEKNSAVVSITPCNPNVTLMLIQNSVCIEIVVDIEMMCSRATRYWRRIDVRRIQREWKPRSDRSKAITALCSPTSRQRPNQKYVR